MTATQLVCAFCGYAVAFVAIAYLARANGRRTLGALVGAAVAATYFLGVLNLGLRSGWWRVPLPSDAGLQTLFYATTAVSLAPIYPVTWRLVRRFSWRGLVVSLIAATVIGPPRDYLVGMLYPQWVTFSPGLGPILAVSATYFGVVGIGHITMWLVSGPANQDRLFQRQRGTA